MIYEREQDGLWFEFELLDWSGDWRQLIAFVRQYKRHSFDDENNRWWIGEEHIDEFRDHVKHLIDDQIGYTYNNSDQEELNL